MISLFALLDDKILLLPIYLRLIIWGITILAFVLLSLWRRWLRVSGLIAASIIGVLILFMGGYSAFAFLAFFFVLGSLLSRLSNTENSRRDRRGRDALQVLSNSAPGLLFLFVYFFTGAKSAALIAFASSISEDMADTFSSSFGPLSNEMPRSIVTFTPVPKGISGGVTALGTLMAFLGSALIGLLYIAIYELTWTSFLIILFTGFFGSVLDSLMGGTIQVQYRRKDGALTEESSTDGEENSKVRGICLVTNDTVNFLSSLISSLLAFVVSYALAL